MIVGLLFWFCSKGVLIRGFESLCCVHPLDNKGFKKVVISRGSSGSNRWRFDRGIFGSNG